MDTLTIPHINHVKGNLTLPTKGRKGETIYWASSHPEIITTTGEVNRPKYGSGNVVVKLTATISNGKETNRKEFKANVREMPKKENYEAYLFAYFTGEGYENGEQIYFSLSEGNHPLFWQELNEGKPVLISQMGEKGLRDPFLIRSPEGDKFYLIATDLKIYGSYDWEEAQMNGSRSIMVWESDDLVSWSKQRMVEVSPPEAGNTWAPEIVYDFDSGHYVVFWASKIIREGEEKGKSNYSYQKIMYAKTRDFYTFTEPEIYMDYGYSIIDTTMIEHDGRIYRFTKDERNNTKSSPNGKFVFQEVGHSIFASNFKRIREGIGRNQLSQGEGPIIFKANYEERWYLFIDEFGGRGYVPFVTTDLNSGEWTIPKEYNLPSRSRHGSILPITRSESLALKQKYLKHGR